VRQTTNTVFISMMKMEKMAKCTYWYQLTQVCACVHACMHVRMLACVHAMKIVISANIYRLTSSVCNMVNHCFYF